MHKIPLLISSLLLLLIIGACRSHPKKKVVAVSHSGLIGDWGRNVFLEMQLEVAYYQNEVEYVFKDSKGDLSTQRHDIEGFISDGVDAMIVFPTIPDS